MTSSLRTLIRPALALTVVAAGLTLPAAAGARLDPHTSAASPISPLLAAIQPAVCISAAGQVQCDLWAKAGTTDLPGRSGLPIWGFVDSALGTPSAPGGPTLVFDQGDQVTIILHNDLPVAGHLSLGLTQQAMLPDTQGAPQGGTAVYQFTASRPGTSLYEAGPTADAHQQVAMGLYGAMIVRPPGTVQASITTGLGGDSDITLTAVSAGTSGNAISIEYIDPLGAADQTLSVSVTGTAIAVTPATDSGGGITTTAADVAGQINLAPDASALVSAAVAGGGAGAGLIAPMPALSLAGGKDAAYGPSSQFDEEAVLLLSEIDPALNQAADPSTFDMQGFMPTYRLINGRTYNNTSGAGAVPSTDPIPAMPGDRVLLRFLNAGIEEHSMGLLGTRQTIIANDSAPLPYAYGAVAETVEPGETLDALVEVAAAAPSGSQMAIAEQGQHLDLVGQGWKGTPDGTLAEGGMLTFITTPDAADPCAGPAASNGSAAPAVTNGTTPVVVSATFTACTPTGGAQKSVDQLEYFVDAVGADGSGTAVPAINPALPSSAPVTGTVTFDAAALTALGAGPHTVYMHAHDDGGFWGGYDAELFFVDRVGPDTTAMSLNPNPANGTVAVDLEATADDSTTGDQQIQAAELFVGATGANGSGTPMSAADGSFDSSIEAISGTLPAAAVAALGEGAHVVSIHSQDAFGNWGGFTTQTLTVDTTGPVAGNVTWGPSPNNGTRSINPNTFELEVRAQLDDPVSNAVNSNVTAVEGFVSDTQPAAGQYGAGAVAIPVDGAFNSPSEAAYIRLPLQQINALSSGPHKVWVHGRDAAGNWGNTTSGTIIVDKTGPSVSGLTLSAGNATLTGTAADPVVPGTGTGSKLTAAEWFIGPDPGRGNANPALATDGTFDSPSEALTASLPPLAPGSTTISMRARDEAGNWGPVSTITVGAPAPLFVSNFSSGNLSAWSSATGGSAIAATTAARLAGPDSYGMQTTLAGKLVRYVTDGTPAAEPTYHARFYLSPNGAVLGSSKPVVFAGLNSSGKQVLSVQLQKVAAGYRLRAGAISGTKMAFTGWYVISNTGHPMEVAWSAAAGSLSLYIDGTLKQTRTGLASGTNRIESVRLGPSTGLATGDSGAIYFDDFVSTRASYIGP